jgi:hypothetical protein
MLTRFGTVRRTLFVLMNKPMIYHDSFYFLNFGPQEFEKKNRFSCIFQKKKSVFWYLVFF